MKFILKFSVVFKNLIDCIYLFMQFNKKVKFKPFQNKLLTSRSFNHYILK